MAEIITKVRTITPNRKTVKGALAQLIKALEEMPYGRRFTAKDIAAKMAKSGFYNSPANIRKSLDRLASDGSAPELVTLTRGVRGHDLAIFVFEPIKLPPTPLLLPPAQEEPEHKGPVTTTLAELKELMERESLRGERIENMLIKLCKNLGIEV